MTHTQLQEMIRLAKTHVEAFIDSDPFHSTDKPEEWAMCWVWALALSNIMRKRGHDALLQAGTHYWSWLGEPDFDPTRTDGHDCFGYQFDYEKAMQTLAFRRILPEMHCWVALFPKGYREKPDAGSVTIIDPLTRALPLQCKSLLGYDWPVARMPPDYLMFQVKDAPAGVVYKAYPDARRLVLAVARSVVGMGPLELSL